MAELYTSLDDEACEIVVKPKFRMPANILHRFVVAIFCAVTLPSGGAVDGRETKAAGGPPSGWYMVQKNKIFGHIQVLYWPGHALRFRTSIVDGFLVHYPKGFKLELVNEESKKYKIVTPDEFRQTIQQYRRKDPDYKPYFTRMGPGEEMFGLPTMRLDYGLRKISPPHVEFPDHMWTTTAIPMPQDVESWLRVMLEVPTEVKLPGYPLRVEQTITRNPDRMEVVYGTMKCEKKTFKLSDFEIPQGYKQTHADGEVFNFGM